MINIGMFITVLEKLFFFYFFLEIFEERDKPRKSRQLDNDENAKNIRYRLIT